jgi:hypothetical protein
MEGEEGWGGGGLRGGMRGSISEADKSYFSAGALFASPRAVPNVGPRESRTLRVGMEGGGGGGRKWGGEGEAVEGGGGEGYETNDLGGGGEVSEEGKAAGSRIIASSIIVASALGVFSAAVSWYHILIFVLNICIYMYFYI